MSHFKYSQFEKKPQKLNSHLIISSVFIGIVNMGIMQTYLGNKAPPAAPKTPPTAPPIAAPTGLPTAPTTPPTAAPKLAAAKTLPTLLPSEKVLCFPTSNSTD